MKSPTHFLFKRTRSQVLVACIGLAAFQAVALADFSTALTDNMTKSNGTIDLLKNVSGAQLTKYLAENGSLMVGVDINKDASNSQGLALKMVEFQVTTSKGTYSFSDYSTGTSAIMRDNGNTTRYSTLFGQAGQNTLSSSTQGFALSPYDSVLAITGVNVEGEIKSATVKVHFLNTNSRGGNEDFFKFDKGTVGFSILSTTDARTLDAAKIGIAEAPASVTYTSAPMPIAFEPIVHMPAESASAPVETSPASMPPAAPFAPWMLIVGFAVLFISRTARHA